MHATASPALVVTVITPLVRGYLQGVVRMVYDGHELSQRRAAQYAVVGHCDVSYVEDDVLCPVVLLGAECHGQEDLAQWLGDSRVDTLERP